MLMNKILMQENFMNIWDLEYIKETDEQGNHYPILYMRLEREILVKWVIWKSIVNLL